MNDYIVIINRVAHCDICNAKVERFIRLIGQHSDCIYVCKSCAERITALVPKLEEYPPQPIYEFFD